LSHIFPTKSVPEFAMARLSLAAFVGIALLGLPVVGYAAAPEQLSIESDDGAITLTRYAADHGGTHPAVLLLHGARGVELNPGAYRRYAERLAESGVDAYLVSYFTATDYAALASKTSTPNSREAYETGRFDGWAKRMSSVVTAVISRPDCSGNIGLLGFSLGGYVAADTAAHDERVRALAVLYGGMPDAMVAHVKHLPPLLELHGEADLNVPLQRVRSLWRLPSSSALQPSSSAIPGGSTDSTSRKPTR
jgi:carboxymethylenebutenolidase